jgi:hypothetical protein
LAQTDARAAAVLRYELDAGLLEGALHSIRGSLA